MSKPVEEASGHKPTIAAEVKLEAVRDAAAYEFPTCDIEQMLAEVERGYTS